HPLARGRAVMGLPPELLRDAIEEELSYRRLELYQPYRRQTEFHAAGLTFRERLFLAGNQLGKTLSAGAEAAMHLTGRYPYSWPGRVWQRGVVGWAASETGELTRDTVERMLLGRAGKRGTGMIPADCIMDITAARGVADAAATARIKHSSGRSSLLVFKSYDQGRERWQGETLDFCWFDEEPPAAIYDEGLTRTNATGGVVWLTCTPLQGMTQVIERFFPVPNTPDRSLTMMTIDDAGHYSAADREKIIAGYPEHEREARARGIPTLGSGRVFPVPEALIREPAAAIPHWWRRVVGLDFGHGDHPTAAAWLAHDPETDTVHVYDAYRNRDPGIVMHAAALRARGDWIPVAWPADGLQTDKVSSETVAGHYRQAGCRLLLQHATHRDGGVGVEAGLVEMLERFRTSRLRVAEHLGDWWEEYRLYHRKDGKLVKLRDDLMSATRYGLMMLRHAAVEPRGPQRAMAEGGNFDPLGRW
ncbi:MAG: terminase large subunit, partial [Acetobacteraceae bacterium]|nr:terminase large subunit [Acetobacteraceae bacterium]